MDFWMNITEPQATLLSGICTLIAALVAVFLGSYVFAGKVTTLQEAISSSSGDLDDHVSRITEALRVINEKVSEVEEITLSVGSQAARKSGDENEISMNSEEISPTPMPPPDVVAAMPVSSDEGDNRQAFKDVWERIRKAIEDKASSEKIDGRTRAKYLRIDRRNYLDLAEALIKDGYFSGVSRELREAIDMRHSFRNGRKLVSPQDVLRIRSIADMIERQV